MRLNRKRFWGKDMDADKLSAFQTLYTCLEKIALLMAPISPFFADQLYTDLTSATTGSTKSVHLADWPVAGETDPELEARMKMIQDITSMVLALRRKVNIKVRQPLSTLMIPVNQENMRQMIEPMKQLLLNEVNVQELKFVSGDTMVKRVKPDFKKLGPKYGKNMKAVAAAVASMSQALINELESKGSVTFDVNSQPVTIDRGDVEIITEDMPGWQMASDGALTVALDVTITPELRAEGMARELVNRIQNIRKARNYDIQDRIRVTFAPEKSVEQALASHTDYIARQVLASKVDIAAIESADDCVESLDIDGLTVLVKVEPEE